ncbi:MAG: ribose-phosphate pyrophosphokinase-like domain-containing protein, partial [Flavobacteriales bacterium]
MKFHIIFAPPKSGQFTMFDMVKIIAGSVTRELGQSIAQHLGLDLGNVIIQRFSDGEFQPSIEETVRGKDV